MKAAQTYARQLLIRIIMEKKDLKPTGVFHYFEEICQVPRPSKKEEKIIAYLKAFGEKHKPETF